MIEKIQLYAERHTGSKWLTGMFKESFGIDNPWEYGWKHWLPDFEKIENTDNDNCLFVVLTRNPYYWISAMNKSPHHARPRLKKLDIDTFVQEEWECEWTKKDVPWITDEMDGTEMMHERNPDTGERFKNIVELRNYKNREFLKLKDKVKHVCYVKYDDLLVSPLKTINEIVANYPVKLIKPTRPTASGEHFKELTPSAIKFIEENIDWELEAQLGFKKEDIKR